MSQRQPVGSQTTRAQQYPPISILGELVERFLGLLPLRCCLFRHRPSLLSRKGLWYFKRLSEYFCVARFFHCSNVTYSNIDGFSSWVLFFPLVSLSDSLPIAFLASTLCRSPLIASPLVAIDSEEPCWIILLLFSPKYRMFRFVVLFIICDTGTYYTSAAYSCFLLYWLCYQCNISLGSSHGGQTTITTKVFNKFLFYC